MEIKDIEIGSIYRLNIPITKISDLFMLTEFHEVTYLTQGFETVYNFCGYTVGGGNKISLYLTLKEVEKVV